MRRPCGPRYIYLSTSIHRSIDLTVSIHSPGGSRCQAHRAGQVRHEHGAGVRLARLRPRAQRGRGSAAGCARYRGEIDRYIDR
eukprot:scaffold4073_cov61-Phaeocystis_antarctica.AAC.2